MPKIQLGAGSTRQRTNNDTNFADTEVEELVAMLRETENLEEQGDILQYLVDNQGLDFNTGMYPNGLHPFINFICTQTLVRSHPTIQPSVSIQTKFTECMYYKTIGLTIYLSTVMSRARSVC